MEQETEAKELEVANANEQVPHKVSNCDGSDEAKIRRITKDRALRVYQAVPEPSVVGSEHKQHHRHDTLDHGDHVDIKIDLGLSVQARVSLADHPRTHSGRKRLDEEVKDGGCNDLMPVRFKGCHY